MMKFEKYALDVGYQDLDSIGGLVEYLSCGGLIVVRGVPELFYFRQQLLDAAFEFSDGDLQIRPDILGFYEQSNKLPLRSALALTKAIKLARSNRYLSYVMSGLIEKIGFSDSSLLDGGINRLVVPSESINEYKESMLFMDTDFKRTRADGEVEIFMGGYSNIHRDLNRQHSFLMCNLWIPMHDVPKNESLIFFPEVYYDDNIVDMENICVNYEKLKAKVQFELKFGDLIVFHSEQMHASPIPSKPNHRRHSFDFRIMSDCQDDGKHYRYNFWRLSNFKGSAHDTLKLIEYAKNTMHPNQYDISMDKQDAYGVFESYKKYIFSEDILFNLAKYCVSTDRKLASLICDYILSKTESYFWMYLVLQFCLHSALNENVGRYKDKAFRLAQEAKFDFAYNPIQYCNPTNQITPNDVIIRLSEEIYHSA